MSNYDNICNSIHLPLQSGSDKILKRMNRTYTRKHFIELAKNIRKKMPNAGISTDIIVGFPGESEQDFLSTIKVMEEVKFDSAFTFKYSPKIGPVNFSTTINETIASAIPTIKTAQKDERII